MKVLIVDDHPIVRAGLHRLLTAIDPQTEVTEAASGREAIAGFRKSRPDLVILDLNLPGIGGLEVIGRLRIEDPNAQVLVISMYDNPAYVARVLKAGARGYVSKNAPPEEIIEAARRVASGLAYIEHQMAQELALDNLQNSAQRLDELAPRDIEILRLLAAGENLTEIAQALGISYKTVANHCTRLKARLATPRMADLIRAAILFGLSADDSRLAGVGSEL